MAKVQDRRRGLDRNSDMERWGSGRKACNRLRHQGWQVRLGVTVAAVLARRNRFETLNLSCENDVSRSSEGRARAGFSLEEEIP